MNTLRHAQATYTWPALGIRRRAVRFGHQHQDSSREGQVWPINLHQSKHVSSWLTCTVSWPNTHTQHPDTRTCTHTHISSYPLLSSAPSWIRCPCLETRWSRDGPWSHTRCPFWAQIGQHCARRGPSHPGSATGLVRAPLMIACTKLCNPGWTGTDDPPEKMKDHKVTAAFSISEHWDGGLAS